VNTATEAESRFHGHSAKSLPESVWVIPQPFQLHVVAGGVSVAELCILRDIGTMSAVTAFMVMEAGSVRWLGSGNGISRTSEEVLIDKYLHPLADR
jgi:hypothetical protein